MGVGWGSGPWGSGPWGGASAGQLQLLQAVASRENEVQLVFSDPVYFSQVADVGDASQRRLYAVTADPSSRGMDGVPPRAVMVAAVALVDAPGFSSGQVLALTLDRPLSPSPSLYAVTVSADDVASADRATTLDPDSATQQFEGCHKILAAPTPDAPSPRATRDFANPQTRADADDAGQPASFTALGTIPVDDSGDYATDEGLVDYRKRIIRSVVSAPSGFVHLGDSYGAGALRYGKRLASAANRQELVTRAELQVRREPETVAAKCALQQTSTVGLFRLVILARTRLGRDVKVSIPIIVG